MSDLSIPGIQNRNSSINSEQVINDLLELERVPINRLERTISRDEELKQVWNELGRRISDLNQSANFLYSFQNPFNNRVGLSSNEKSLTIEASREADETSHQIEIDSLATRDKFSSRPISNNTEVAAGTYRFSIGKEEVLLNWSGGRLANFVRALNDRGAELLNVRSVPYSATESILIFEALRGGESSALQFHEDALALALSEGVLEYNPVTEVDIPTLHTALPQTQVEIDLPQRLNLQQEDLQLQYDIRVMSESDAIGTSLEVLRSGSATLEGVTVQNFLSVNLLEDEPAAPAPKVEDLEVLYVIDNGSAVSLPHINEDREFTTYSINLADYSNSIEALLLDNKNTHKTVQIQNIRVRNRREGDYTPLNPIEEHGNARIKIDGVAIERETNSIDDVIPGATLELLAETEKPIQAEVLPDYEGVKEAIITFVGNYNQLIRDVNIFSRNESQVIDEIEYFTPEERDVARERLGILSGEITINQLRNRLITITQNSYPTPAGRAINLLSQIGIATNAVGANTGTISRSRLRGYLEIDESQLDTTLQSNFYDIRELFGSDQDDDLVVDTGIGLEIDRYTDLFIQAGGVIQTRNAGLDGSIERASEQRDTYTRRLERYEENLRRDFGRMEGALNALEEQTRSLDNLRNNNN